MIGFQQKRRLRQFLYSNVTLTILFVAIIFLAHSTFKLWQKERDTREAMDARKSELTALAAKEANLSSRVAALKTDRGVEETIRGKFKVAKVGEGVIVIVVIDQKDKESDTLTPTNPFQALFDKIMGYFK